MKAGTRAPRDTFEAVERLAGGLGTAILALLALVATLAVGVACLVGVGLPLLPMMLTVVRNVAERERGRLRRWGYELVSPYTEARPAGWSSRMRAAREDPATGRDLRWMVLHASLGLLLSVLGLILPILAVRDTTFPLWWRLLPSDEAGASLGFAVHTWPEAIAVGLLGVSWLAILVGLAPAMARLQARPGVRLLGPHPSVDLSHRVAELTATRAGALTAHTAELRRIERALHDGTQNRLVGVVVLLGAARRAVVRDPATADAALERAQGAAEQALGELRTVVRGILPPVLEQRGLPGALNALAADCGTPCRVAVGELADVPVSVEATAYFVVAEALTNVSLHSRAADASVEIERTGVLLTVRVHDDGVGGASEATGSGLAGVRRRVAAHDGTMTLTSPCGGPTILTVELPCGS
ncbi:sensor histidine kinase [Phytoactinopolyspora endophytica]|uniref:sensor histidine kinase n=1 Tax=Phytoactinopolyspora endophytica TaxID=1642495 RepID=UPI00197CB0E1|nr:sensor histidine kinase [Phytoactinopolyspora endophytica]